GWNRPAIDHVVGHDAATGSSDRDVHRRALRRAVLGAFAVEPTHAADDADTEPHPRVAPEQLETADERIAPIAPDPKLAAELRAHADRDACGTLHRLRRKGVLFTLLVALCFVAMACDRSPGLVLWHAYNGAERQA